MITWELGQTDRCHLRRAGDKFRRNKGKLQMRLRCPKSKEDICLGRGGGGIRVSITSNERDPIPPAVYRGGGRVTLWLSQIVRRGMAHRGENDAWGGTAPRDLSALVRCARRGNKMRRQPKMEKMCSVSNCVRDARLSPSRAEREDANVLTNGLSARMLTC